MAMRARDWLWIGLVAGGFALAGCDKPEEPPAPAGNSDPALNTFRKEVSEMEGRLDAFQKKLQNVMEGLKAPAAPGEEEAGKPATPSEELQEVMESLQTPAAREAGSAGEEEAGKPATPGEELQEAMESLPTPAAREAARKPAQPAQENGGAGERAIPAAAPAEEPAPAPRPRARTEAARPAPVARPRPDFGTAQARREVPAVIEDGSVAFDQGLADWRQNNLSAAIGHFEEAVAAEPNNAHAHWNLALLFDRQGEGEKALAAMERAEEIYRLHGEREDMLRAREHLLKWYKKYGGRAGVEAPRG